MSVLLSGPGQTFPYPLGLSPQSLWTAPATPITNTFRLRAGQAMLIPAGTWIVATETSTVEYFDPVTQAWWSLGLIPTEMPSGITIRSDGFNFRIHNQSGTAADGNVTAPGSGYVQATTHVTPSAGNSTWRAVVGGAVSLFNVLDGGSGYTLPPIVMVAAPPPGGEQATAGANISNGIVTSVVMVTHGSGYTSPPQVQLVTCPNDPNIDSIRPATVVAGQLDNLLASAVTNIVLVNFGEPLAVAPTLTITGSGTGATATIVTPNLGPWLAPVDDLIFLQLASGP